MNMMRVVKIEYLDGTVENINANFLYVNCLGNVKAIDDTPLAF